MVINDGKRFLIPEGNEIKQLDVGVSPPAFSVTLIVTLTFGPDL